MRNKVSVDFPNALEMLHFLVKIDKRGRKRSYKPVFISKDNENKCSRALTISNIL